MRSYLLILALLVFFEPSYSQSLLKKAKEKVNQGSKVLRDIKGNDSNNNSDKSTESDNGEEATNTSTRSGRPSNTKGKKLSASSVDVNQEIKAAEGNFLKKDYGLTRKSIQQALLGIEVAMAYKILESLPRNVNDLQTDMQNDHVAASGSGYQGLTVNREYFAATQERTNYSDEYNDEYEGEKYLQFSLVNSQFFVSGITNYINNPMYSSSSDGEKKVVKFKDINSLLEYNEYDGYKLSVPLGNNTLVQFACVNFDDEDEVLKAAEFFDLEPIKKYLGEK